MHFMAILVLPKMHVHDDNVLNKYASKSVWTRNQEKGEENNWIWHFRTWCYYDVGRPILVLLLCKPGSD